MKAAIRLPKNFKLYSENGPLYSNFDNELNMLVANEIRNKPLIADFIAYNFHGLIWWDEGLGCWCIEISQNRLYKGTFISDELISLISEV
ncbi:hypothetical protein CEQ15_11250 [Chryseobacterium indologenes]|uniref:hypothetical protein n=1 Tax=Chryseobacterium indologenes TaxID=253 RepID=UPI000B516644|nr:hypothetical protein [Chryseobacterium indologenes]ASE62024.1 hypothetical protein CEQ15_11250 [Chryseobacterium indologenes]